MLGKFEDTENPENSHEREAAGTLCAFAVALGLLDDEDDEVREDRQHVNDVHRVVAELPLRRTRHEAHQELPGKPGDARLLAQRTTSMWIA